MYIPQQTLYGKKYFKVFFNCVVHTTKQNDVGLKQINESLK